MNIVKSTTTRSKKKNPPKKTASLYELLNLNPKATMEEIRLAYISSVKIHHPDANGGDAEMFLRIKAAYDILIDPIARQQYDETGYIKGDAESEVRKSAFENLCNIWGDLVLKIRPEELPRIDIVDTMRMTVAGALEKYQGDLATLDAEECMLRRSMDVIKKRIKRKKKGGHNIFIHVCEKRLELLHQHRAPLKHKIAVVNAALEMIAEYSFEVDTMPRFTTTKTTSMPWRFPR